MREAVSDDIVRFAVQGLQDGQAYEVLVSKTGSRPATFRLWFATPPTPSTGRELLDTDKLVFT